MHDPDHEGNVPAEARVRFRVSNREARGVHDRGMSKPRSVPTHHVALAIEAATAVEFETEPLALREMATRIDAIMPSLADELRQRARQAIRLRTMLAMAVRGNLADLT